MGELLVHVPTPAMIDARVHPLPPGYEANDVSVRWDQVFVLAGDEQRCELFESATRLQRRARDRDELAGRRKQWRREQPVHLAYAR